MAGCSPINPSVESLDRSKRSADSKVVNRSLVEIQDADDDDDANNSMNNHSMLFALNASEPHFNDLSALLQENRKKEDRTLIKRRGCESQTKVCKIKEEVDELLPSEVIVSVQDLLASLSMHSLDSRSDVIEMVLCQVKRVLEDPHKVSCNTYFH